MPKFKVMVDIPSWTTQQVIELDVPQNVLDLIVEYDAICDKYNNIAIKRTRKERALLMSEMGDLHTTFNPILRNLAAKQLPELAAFKGFCLIPLYWTEKYPHLAKRINWKR